MTEPEANLSIRPLRTKILRLMIFGYISLLAMWTICLFVQLLSLYFAHSLSLPPTSTGNSLQFTDFVRLYTAGKITLSPARELFYSWEIQKQVLENITHCVIANGDFYNQVTPFVFLLMAPFALLPIDSAHLLFDFTNLCFGLAGYWFAVKTLPQSNKKMTWLILIGTLASVFSWNTLVLGQVSWFYLGLLCFYIALLLKGRDMIAGLALALCVIKPQYFPCLLIPAFCLGRYRMLFIALAWDIVFFFVCVLVFGLKAIITYPFALMQCESSLKSTHVDAMYCLLAFFSHLQSEQWLYRLCLMFLALAFIVLAVIIIYRFKKGTKSGQATNWMIASVVLGSLLFSLHTHSHDCLFLVVPALLTLPFYPAFEKQSFSLNLWQWLFYLMPVLTWVAHFLNYFDLRGNLFFTALMAILLACALKQFWSESRV